MLAYKLEHTDEFEALEAAVRETPRGRAFLDELACRIRATETDRVLQAIERLSGAGHTERMPQTHLDAHLLNGPAREGEGVAQDDVDRLLKAVESGEVPAVPQSQGDTDTPAVPPAPAPEAVPDALVASQDDIDQLFK